MKKNEPDFFEDWEDDVIEVVENAVEFETRQIMPFSCPECGMSMKLKGLNPEDRKDKRKAWWCNTCGRQTYDEYGRR